MHLVERPAQLTGGPGHESEAEAEAESDAYCCDHNEHIHFPYIVLLSKARGARCQSCVSVNEKRVAFVRPAEEFI
jgi:hypothetical protein